jgi:hypothetical protein
MGVSREVVASVERFVDPFQPLTGRVLADPECQPLEWDGIAAVQRG